MSDLEHSVMSAFDGISTIQSNTGDARERPTSTSIYASTSTCQSIPIPPEPFLIDLFCNWIEDPEAVLIRDWGCEERGVIGSWSIAEFLRDVLDVRGRIWGELGVEERGRLRPGAGEEEDVFIAVVAGGCYAFVVLALAVYVIGGVIVPLCRCISLFSFL